MSGITQALSIAKEALLTHQLSVQVASHNIANVDTPGYTRQTLRLEPNQATIISQGSLGGGVHGAAIERKYDQFMVDRLIQQETTTNGLVGQQEALQMVEAIFNETPGLALNDLLSQFWASWQGLSDNPEIAATRQTVTQMGELLAEQLQIMNDEIIRVKLDFGVRLDTAINDVNSITSQIANINLQINSSEIGTGNANDLRDRRDTLVKELAGLVDIEYFETGTGYTVLLSDGHPLVASIDNWEVDWQGNQLLWVNELSDGTQTKQPIGVGAELGGKIGGWLEVRGQLVEGQTDNYLGRLDAFTSTLIREVNQQHSQGVGTVKFTGDLLGSETAANTARLTTPVDASTAGTTIAANSIKINDRDIGEIDGAAAVNGLAMEKAYNAANAINTARPSGVKARITTLYAGSAITSGLNNGQAISFTINGTMNGTSGITVSHTAVANETAAETARNVVAAINTAITAYNADATNPVEMSMEAVVGDGYNGGAINAIVLRNTNAGDESRIVISDVDLANAAEIKLGLTDGTYAADATHNTGELTLFSDNPPFTVSAGPDDNFLTQLGMGGGNTTTTSFTGGSVAAAGVNTNVTFNLNDTSVNVVVTAGDSAATVVSKLQTAIATAGFDITVSLTGGKIKFQNSTSGDNAPITVDSFTVNAGDGTIFGFTNFTATIGGVAGDTEDSDGKFSYSYDDGGVAAGLAGYKYFDDLATDGGSFDIWIYNSDDTLALPQAVTVNLERVYDLYDVADAIETAITNASTETPSWIDATVDQNRLKLSPDSSHYFVFANDTSNFLQVAGLNTFFRGYNSATIGINDSISNDINLVAAATVTSRGEIYKGDNTNALLVAGVPQNEDLSFNGSNSTNSLDGFYNSLVGEIGNRSRTVGRELEFNTMLTNQLNEMRDGTSGVSLDEEMANLIKFQQAYSAAARIISLADEMLATLLESVKR